MLYPTRARATEIVLRGCSAASRTGSLLASPHSRRLPTHLDGHGANESLAERRHRRSILVVVALTSLLASVLCQKFVNSTTYLRVGVGLPRFISLDGLDGAGCRAGMCCLERVSVVGFVVGGGRRWWSDGSRMRIPKRQLVSLLLKNCGHTLLGCPSQVGAAASVARRRSIRDRAAEGFLAP
jgi:hypothetical protein